MTRYQALRHMGCGRFTAWLIALMNDIRGVPQGEIRFMTVIIEYTP